jgi:hypothetical protein
MNRALPPIAVLTTCLAILAAPATAGADEPTSPASAPGPILMVPSPAIPPPILPPEPAPTHVQSRGLIGGGVAAMVVGLLAVAGGGIVLQFAEAAPFSLGFGSFGPPYDTPPPRSNTGIIAGAGLIAGGVVLFGGGITMIVFGAQRVPDVPAKRAAGAAIPSVAVGPRGGTLAWSF